MTYDETVIQAFLAGQMRLFPEPVATTPGEAADFLEDVGATVCDTADEVKEYMLENLDAYGMTDEEILSAEEVFAVPDGRYLIVEG